jgi:integrase
MWVERLKSGKWRGCFRDSDGRIRRRTCLRKTDAKNWALEQESRIKRGDWIDPALGRISFSDWAQNVMAARLNLRPSSRARDESYLRNHVTPAFEATAVARIQKMDVQSWVRSLSEDKALAPRTVRECYRIMSGIMAEAVDHRIITETPCRRISLPRIENVERRFLTAVQVDALADAMDERYSAFVYVGAYLGLRWGELAGLKRQHLHLLKKQMKVVGSLERFDNSYRYVEETKTTSSRRMIPVPEFLRDILAAHLAVAPRSKFVFPAPKGGFIRYHGWRRRFWNPAVDKSGVGPFTPHELRHSAAALMIDQGANPVTVQRRLGHKDIRTTLQLYGHLFLEQDDLLSARLDVLYREAKSGR